MENNDNTNNPTAAPAPAPRPAGTKAPLVKRIKIPTVRPAGTPPQAAKPAQPAQPAAPAAAQPAQPAQTEPVQSAPAPEPELPPENKNQVAEQPIEAKEIEKAPVRKKRRGSSSAAAPSASDEAKKKMEAQLKKTKMKARSLLSNKWNKLAIFVVLLGVICYGVYSSLPTIAEKKLPEIFAANGMPFKSFRLKQITIDTMELTNVSDSSGTLSISNMKFNYSLYSLFSNNIIRAMELNGVTINGEKRSDGISLGAIGGLIASARKSPLTR